MYQLPKSIIVEILSYIQLEDVGRLDTATLNLNSRELLKDILQESTHLQLVRCTGKITKLKYILLRRIKVQVLEFSYGIRNTVLTCLKGYEPRIDEIILRQCDKITDFGLNNISDSCRTLKKINLEGCSVTDKGLARLSMSCLNLTNIDLGFCQQISDEGIVNISRYCHSLVEINLKKTAITDSSLSRLSESCPNLRIINLVWCKLITFEGIRAFCVATSDSLIEIALSIDENFGLEYWGGDIGNTIERDTRISIFAQNYPIRSKLLKVRISYIGVRFIIFVAAELHSPFSNGHLNSLNQLYEGRIEFSLFDEYST